MLGGHHLEVHLKVIIPCSYLNFIIGDNLGRDKSTIGREITRNSFQGKYFVAIHAQALVEERIKVERKSRFLYAIKVNKIDSTSALKAQKKIFSHLLAHARRTITLDNGRENHLHRRVRRYCVGDKQQT